MFRVFYVAKTFTSVIRSYHHGVLKSVKLGIYITDSKRWEGLAEVSMAR